MSKNTSQTNTAKKPDSLFTRFGRTIFGFFSKTPIVSDKSSDIEKTNSDSLYASLVSADEIYNDTFDYSNDKSNNSLKKISEESSEYLTEIKDIYKKTFKNQVTPPPLPPRITKISESAVSDVNELYGKPKPLSRSSSIISDYEVPVSALEEPIYEEIKPSSGRGSIDSSISKAPPPPSTDSLYRAIRENTNSQATSNKDYIYEVPKSNLGSSGFSYSQEGVYNELSNDQERERFVSSKEGIYNELSQDQLKEKTSIPNEYSYPRANNPIYETPKAFSRASGDDIYEIPLGSRMDPVYEEVDLIKGSIDAISTTPPPPSIDSLDRAIRKNTISQAASNKEPIYTELEPDSNLDSNKRYSLSKNGALIIDEEEQQKPGTSPEKPSATKLTSLLNAVKAAITGRG